jgi:hypothetical protein
LAALLALALAGGALGATVPAQAEPPEGADYELFLEVGEPTYDLDNAVAAGWWAREGATGDQPTSLSVDLTDENGDVTEESIGAGLAAVDCGPDLSRLAVVFVPASADPSALGSAERPAAQAGDTVYDLFDWVGGNPPSAYVLDSNGRAGLGAQTAAELASNTIVTVDERWPAGELISLVTVCTTGAFKDNREAYVQPSAEGYAQTSWLTFRTVASPTDPALTSAGYEVLGAKATPVLGLGSAWTGGRAVLTATVADDGGAALSDATGKVDFYTGTGSARTLVGSDTVEAGVATLDVTDRVPAGGAVSFEAAYVPDETGGVLYQPATSGRHTVVAPKAASSVSIAAPPATYGAAATVVVTVAGTSPSGQVALGMDGRSVGAATLTGGKASFTLPATTAAGQHQLTASYAGDSAHAASSGTGALTIGKAATSLKLGLSPKKVKTGKKVKVSVVVTGAAPPTGTVSVKVGSATKQLALSAGRATLSLKAKKPGKLKVSAAYAGDANLGGSQASGTVTVKKPKRPTKNGRG